MVNHDIDKLLSKHSATVRSITKALAAMAKKNAPGVEEKVYFGWHNIVYTYGGMKNIVCVIGPYTHHVNFYLPKGALLKDPDPLFEGAGKTMRHVKVRTLQDARRPALARFVRSAAKLAR